MLPEVPLNFQPSINSCLAWSDDGELAVAAGEFVHVLVRFLPYPYIIFVDFDCSRSPVEAVPVKKGATMPQILGYKFISAPTPSPGMNGHFNSLRALMISL